MTIEPSSLRFPVTVPEGIRFRRVLSDPPLFYARELSSTNETLRNVLGGKELSPWTGLLCGWQTRGKGRPGNSWQSRRGDLTMSLWLPKGSFPFPGPLPLSLWVAAACLLAVEHLGFSSVRWKYPNDLYGTRDPLGKDVSYAKLGGILLEPVGRGRGLIAGIGLNLGSLSGAEKTCTGSPQGDSRTGCAGRIGLLDLPEEGKAGRESPGPIRVGGEISRTLRTLLLTRNGEEVRKELEGRLLWKEAWIVHSRAGHPGVGRVKGLDHDGRLRLEGAGGEIFFLGPNARNVRPISPDQANHV